MADKKNNNYNKSCEFSSEIVAYMYGEIDGPQRDIFDEHLAGCDICTAELAGVSAARLSVMEWRAAEFDALPTPTVAIPYPRPENETGIGWLAAIRGFFAASPGWAATAAVVPISILCLGIVLYTFDLVGPVDVAQGNSAAKEPVANRPALKNSGETISNKTLEVAASKKQTDNELQDATATSKAGDLTPPAAPKAIKVSDKNIRPQRNTNTGDPSVKTPKRNESPAPGRNAPRLNDFEDEEDDSLRLTDLFAQTDTEE